MALTLARTLPTGDVYPSAVFILRAVAANVQTAQATVSGDWYRSATDYTTGHTPFEVGVSYELTAADLAAALPSLATLKADVERALAGASGMIFAGGGASVGADPTAPVGA